MSEMVFKNVIIGFGKGGKTLAVALAKKGESVALIEKDRELYGGTCPNVACIPTKFLIHRALEKMPFTEAIAARKALRKKMQSANYHRVADIPTAEVIDGMARFISDTSVIVVARDGSASIVNGERFFINTGSTPIIPDIPGLKESKNAITSKEALELSELPKKLLIIGAGYISLEFASMFSLFGSEVVMLDIGDKFIPREDEDISKMVFQDLTDSGVDIKMGVEILEVSDNDDDTVVTVKSGTGIERIKAKVLVATGRKPNFQGLGLENTSVKLTERGAVEVGESLKTTAENIWALGDVHGVSFTYSSLDDFRIIYDHLYGTGTRKLSDRLTPTSVFVQPTLSGVGLNEKAAISKGVKYDLHKSFASDMLKAKVLQELRGCYKILTDPETDLILGATIYAAESHETINLVAMAMRVGMTFTEFRNQVFTHPTMTEAFND